MVLRLRVMMFSFTLLAAACSLGRDSQVSELELTATPAGTWISLLAPQAGDSVDLGAPLELRAQVENASEEIERAEIRIDGEIVRRYLMPNPDGADSVAIQEVWLADQVGERELRVYVCFADGRCIESAPVEFDVIAPATAPAKTDPLPAGTTADPSDESTFATVTPEPTAASNANVVTARIITEVLNVRAGPSTQFELVSTLKRNDKIRVYARTEDDWYKIFLTGQERWIYGAVEAGLVELSGPYLSLPIDHGPALPTKPPATETPIPPQYPNLVIEGAELEGGNLICGEPSLLRFRIRNAGVAPTQWGGSIRVRDILLRNQEGRDFQAPNFGILGAGENTPWLKLNLFVDTHYGEKHSIEIIVDSHQQITESNETDNRWQHTYILQQGDCP